MRLPRGTNSLLLVPLLLLAIALVVIGTLQHRWLERLADAERQQIRRNLDFAARRLADEISTEMDRVFRAFLAPERDEVAPLLEEWQRRSPHPDLVAAVYVADRDGDTWSLRRLDPQTNELVDARWPAALEPMRAHVQEIEERGPRQRKPNPMFGSIPALFVMQLPAAERIPEFAFSRPHRVILVQLDRQALSEMVGRLVQRTFDGSGSDVALLSARNVLYRSSASWPDAANEPDVALTFAPIAPTKDRPLPPGEPEPPPPAEAMWRVALRHGGGGLEATVASLHRRNLAIAFFVLLVLGASGVLLVALLRRGERLRAQQSQFIAAMSHELNTPLAVLRVASENLQDGIVHDPEKVSRYVRTIAREASHLSEMVNHVLELAGMNAGATIVARESVDIGAVVEDAVTQARWLPDAGSIEIEVDVDRDLPSVRGNAQALTRAVQNLVTNAMRHGAVGKWVGVRASRRDGLVEITVEDRGAGVDPGDAEHLFEPFYRGRASGGVRGTGLGLTIVKQIVTDHGGSVAAQRRRGGGSAFIIRLPAGGDRD